MGTAEQEREAVRRKRIVRGMALASTALASPALGDDHHLSRNPDNPRK